MNQFKDKIAIITGGGSGIGAALCKELAKRGSIVFVADINENNAEQVVSSILQNGGKASAKRIDVSKENEIKNLIDEAISKYGRLDFLFNNAGAAIGGDSRDISLEQWRKVLDVNLYGELYGSIAAYDVMAKQGFGHIINTASATGLLPQPGNAPYSTSKFAIVGLSLALRYEGADLGVRASIICPGRIKSGMFKSSIVMNVRPEYEEVINNNFENAMDTSKAVKIILKGVSKNRAFIVLPFSIRLAWFLYRLFPKLWESVWIARMRDLRKYRKDA
jgi:NAD(P)-dependent dehydrogenase (short-subunit alcohol dehydrogenase family)